MRMMIYAVFLVLVAVAIISLVASRRDTMGAPPEDVLDGIPPRLAKLNPDMSDREILSSLGLEPYRRLLRRTARKTKGKDGHAITYLAGSASYSLVVTRSLVSGTTVWFTGPDTNVLHRLADDE